MMAMAAQIVLLAMHGVCSIGAVMWCLFFRLNIRIRVIINFCIFIFMALHTKLNLKNLLKQVQLYRPKL